MKRALAQAEAAERAGEVPIGAVLVANGEVVAEGHNLRELTCDPTAHAEMVALRSFVQAGRSTRWRYLGTTMYVTLEPCTMCMGAMVLARVERVVFGAYDPKGGAAVTLYQLGSDPRLNHRVEVRGGVLEDECAGILRRFFRARRRRKKAQPSAGSSEEC